MNKENLDENKDTNFIFKINMKNKRQFKALSARSGISMNDLLNDLIKNVLDLERYEIKK